MKRSLVIWLVLGATALVSCDRAAESRLPASRLTLSEPCDLRRGCRAADESLVATVIFGEEPRALKPFPVRLEVGGQKRADAVTVAFVMQGMEMGVNRYGLISDAPGRWTADVTLPICTSGRSDWIADFELIVADKRWQLQVPFVLGK